MRISDWSSDVCSSDLAGAISPRQKAIIVSRRYGYLVLGFEAWKIAADNHRANGGVLAQQSALGTARHLYTGKVIEWPPGETDMGVEDVVDDYANTALGAVATAR